MVASVLESAVTPKPKESIPSVFAHTGRQRVVNPRIDADPGTRENAITPPVDWNAELLRAGKIASGIDSKNPTRDFGFPKRSATTADYPQFDWDYARTHRLESVPEGGIMIHLNDKCVLVLNPLPFAFCMPFSREANGELFKHMRDPVKIE